MAASGTTGRSSARSAPKRAATARAAPKHQPAPRETSKRTSGAESPLAGAFGGVLRGSVNTMMGTVGLNVPLRAIERLTGAVEHATTLLERLERATGHLDRIDAGFVDRLNDSFRVLADMGDDTRVMRGRVDDLEAEMRELQALLTERMDRVPLLRPSRRARRASKAVAKNGE